MKETSLVREFCIGFAEGLRQVRWERLLVGVVATLVIYGIEELSKTAKASVRQRTKRFDLEDFSLN